MATRARQSAELVGRIKALSISGGILDYGCGRATFLKAARAAGLAPLAGADTSALAVEWLRRDGFSAVELKSDCDVLLPIDASLPFVPQLVSFLDVIEHFEGDLIARFHSWLTSLPAQTRFLLVKVPTSDGLLFRLARLAHSLGVRAPLQQLFQVGSFPAHFQYFSHQSLQRFCDRLGLTVRDVWDDTDFEAEAFDRRVAALRGVSPSISKLIATGIAAVSRTSGWLETRAVIVERQLDPIARPA